MNMDRTVILPDPPERPLDSDCCGNGCTPCVLDIYEDDLRIWQKECQALLNGTCLGHPSTTFKEEDQPFVTLQMDEYSKFPVIIIAQETHDTLRFRFSLHPSQTLGLVAGQHVIVRSTSANGSTVTRQFTPISPVDVQGYFELLIKVYSDGRMSSCVKEWKIGDQIEMRGPFSSLAYTPNKYNFVLMLCAGSGIAPMCQVIHAILGNEEEETRIRLLYANRTYLDVMAKAELDEWQRFWNFSLLFALSQESDIPEYSYKYGDPIQRGHIDRSLLHSELQDKVDKTLILICGTRSFDADMLQYLKEMSIPLSNIHKF